MTKPAGGGMITKRFNTMSMYRGRLLQKCDRGQSVTDASKEKLAIEIT